MAPSEFVREGHWSGSSVSDQIIKNAKLRVHMERADDQLDPQGMSIMAKRTARELDTQGRTPTVDANLAGAWTQVAYLCHSHPGDPRHQWHRSIHHCTLYRLSRLTRTSSSSSRSGNPL